MSNNDWVVPGYLEKERCVIGVGMEKWEAEDCATILNRSFEGEMDLVDPKTGRVFKAEFVRATGLWQVYLHNPERMWLNDSYYFPLINGVMVGVLIGKGNAKRKAWQKVIELREAMGAKPLIAGRK